MDLCNFALLSLNDMIAPNIAELPVIIETIQQQNEHIDIMNSQTIIRALCVWKIKYR